MFFFTALLVVVWTAQWMSFIAAGSLDAEMGNFIRTVAGMDMLLLASGMLLGAVWLWKRQPWGYVVATISNVNFTIYALVLVVGSYTQSMAGSSKKPPHRSRYGFFLAWRAWPPA